MKFGTLESLKTNVAAPARMIVINAETQKPLVDAKGKECYIDFYSPDSEAGRKVDRARNLAAIRKARSGRNLVEDEDTVDFQVEMLAALAAGWYFGPDAEHFSATAARELFSSQEFAWLRKAAFVWVYAEANFINRSSTISAASPSESSAKAEN